MLTVQCPNRLDCDLSELKLLFQVSSILNESRNLQDILPPVLAVIAYRMGMVRGMVAILDRNSSLITVEAAYGLSPEEQERGKYKMGEGVVGKSIQTGNPVIVPRISEEPAFLNRTGSRAGADAAALSFLCVPIKSEDIVVGAISMDKAYDSGENLENDIRLLSIIGTMVARAVRMKQEEIEETQSLREENLRLHDELEQRFRPANIIGNAHSIREAYRQIAQVAPTNTTVLIRGESGVGKELVASAIHYNSSRSKAPYIKVNVSALPEDLVESELFGYEPGAFTSANSLKKGRFELANGGTIFLDEIGDISLSTQVKILRVLQEKEFERLGGTQTIRTNVRIVAATNRDLEKLMEEGKFRRDLFYRISVFPLYVPPLRERKSDIGTLADHFVEKFNRENGATIKRISTPAIDMLMSYHWPGNVRELENCMERACILARNGVIYGFHLPPTLQTPVDSSPAESKGNLESILENMERELILDALKMTKGNITRAAQSLGITERMMGIRVRKYNINPTRMKEGCTP